MSRTERLGFVVIATVLIFMAAGILCTSVASLLALMNAPGAGWHEARVVLASGGGALLALVSVGRAVWSGQEAVRWISLVVLVVAGAGIIGSGVWMTTLDFPNATTPADRAEMQADAWRQLPWWVGYGTLSIVMGSLFLLPSVGHYLSYRRGTRGARPTY